LITICGDTDIGLVRKTNQDSFSFKVLDEFLCYAVVCDGMGGTSGGHIASQTATAFVTKALERDLGPGMSGTSLKNVMMSAAAGANALVYSDSRENPELEGMGTTLVIAVVSGERVYVTYVGDSRVYYVNGYKESTQLTKDHTVVQMLVDLGEISPEEALTHPKRHFITRAVGVTPSVEADFADHHFLPGDSLLLCSDGLYGYVGPDQLTGRLLHEHLAQCRRSGGAQTLIELAKAIGGGGDNITAVVISRSAEAGDPPQSPGEEGV